MTKEEIIQAISDDKMMPFIQPEQLAQIVEFVINNYRPSLPSDADDLGAITYLIQRGYTVILPEGVDVAELYKAASSLVDAVERYMRQECLRSELAMKKDKLKELLK